MPDNMKHSAKKFIWGIVLLSFGLSALVVYCLRGNSAAFAFMGSFLWPDRMVPVEVTINNKSYKMSAYYKRHGNVRENNETEPALLLCDLPLSPLSIRDPHLKLFRDWIGVFQTPSDWFQVSFHYVLLREGARISVSLEDDMKGWDAEYTVQENQSQVRYEIFPSPPCQPDHIVIKVPLSGMKNMRKSSTGGKEEANRMLRFLPYRSQ